jgi:hypothetical protein
MPPPQPTVESLTQKLNWANKRVSYAWAKVYETANERLEVDYQNYTTIERTVIEQAVPEHIKTELKSMADRLKQVWECPICMDFITPNDLEITNCGHYYCKGCLVEWKETERRAGNDKWKCCSCNRRSNY